MGKVGDIRIIKANFLFGKRLNRVYKRGWQHVEQRCTGYNNLDPDMTATPIWKEVRWATEAEIFTYELEQMNLRVGEGQSLQTITGEIIWVPNDSRSAPY